jgi:hypothetical protein
VQIGLHWSLSAMSTTSRKVIWGGQILGANIRARQAREGAQNAARETDRAEAGVWSLPDSGYG